MKSITYRLLNATSLRTILAVVSFWLLAAAVGREREPSPVRATVLTGREGCTVDLDSAPVGKTESKGDLALAAVEPGDHYVHIQCPNEQGKAYFISPRAGENLRIHHGVEGAPSPEAASAPLEPAEIKVRLRRHIQEAIQLRTRGRIEEAIQHLRDAYRLDPENSDLHREMGITFLVAKEWKRARVEMLEAVRYDPSDADAHNGLGYALEKLGDLEGALTEYRKAARLEPNDPIYRRHYLDALGKLAAKQAEKKNR
jgi:tetratricopeptide (TPR) repeat protein